MADALLIVFSNPVDGADEDEYNRWYTDIHVRDVLRMGGATVARRYKSAGVALLPGVPEPGKYAAVYQVEADSVEQIERIAASMQQEFAGGDVEMSPTFDLTTVQAAWVLPVTDDITH